MSRGNWTRRELLKAGTAAFAVPYLIPSHVLAAPGRTGANDKANVAIIGLGGRARGIANSTKDVPQMQIVAICDCFKPLCDSFTAAVGEGQKWNAYDDFNKMYDKEKLDGVMVETTTHARAWVVVNAMQAGMDTYIEKPMSLTIAEGRYMVDAARHYKRVTQVGTQQRSMPMNNWASDLVKNGAIGKIRVVLAPNFCSPDRWTNEPAQPMPEGGGDKWWDTWTNQAEFRPYHTLLHRGWGRWWAYDGGGQCFGVTGWGTHSYDQINRALGTDDTGPAEVVLEEPVEVRDSGRFEPRETVGGLILGDTGDEDTGTLYHGMAKLKGPRAKVKMKFANGTELRLHLDGDLCPGDKLASNPKELVRAADNPGPNKRDENTYHIENWIECMNSREKCNADIEIGQRATTLCYLVNIAREVGLVGKTLKWDPQAERFTNCDEGNKLLSRERREGYELPKLA